MHIKNKRGQSTVEYILLVTAVIGVMIVFSTSQNGVLQTQLNNSFTTISNDINGETQQLDGSHGGSPAVNGGGVPPYSVSVAP